MQNQDFKTLVEMFHFSAARYSKKEALVFGAKRITYRELRDTVLKLAFCFDEMNIGKHDNVALWLPNCPEFIYAYFATLQVGATVVPINNMLKREEAKFIIEDSGAKIIICSIDKLEEVEVILTRVDSFKQIICTPSCNKKN